MNTQKEERTILAFKLHSKANPDHGDIRSVAEYIDGQLHELTVSNFCHTNKVFIPVGYQDINAKFREGEVFRISISLSENTSTIVDPYEACKYKAQGTKAERLKPNELIEVIDGELPDRNNRYFEGALPSSVYIFIRNKTGDCFGPFSWEYREDDSGFTLDLINDKPLLKSYKLSRGQIFKIKSENFDKYSFSFSVEEKTCHFILSIHEFISNSEYYEYASDEDIVHYCSKLASEIGPNVFITKTNWDSFKKLASLTKFNHGLSKDRLTKLSDIASDIFIMQDDVRDNIDKFLKSNNGEPLIKDFVERQRQPLLNKLRDEILNEKNKDIEEKNDKLSLIEQKIKDKQRDLEAKSAEVERKRQEADKEVILEQAVAERDEEINKLDKEINEKTTKLTDLLKNHDLLEKLEDIKDEIKKLEDIYDYQRKKNDSLESTTKKLQNEYNTAEDDLRSKLILYKPYVEAINGSFIFDKREKRSISIAVKNMTHGDVFEQQRLVVETVRQNLRLKGRCFESWQVANLLISTQQSFITFFAGLPGVGKTSLARLIAQSQQLEPRLQEVSVARGWTSQKDLIGFYNPLSNRFQSSNTGLYTFIEALSSEKKDEQAMAYVLLDEANLSPIEHYWSAFMAMADGEGERMLRLGQEMLPVPSTLRFLATINYDGTTEPLSPRVVDRAPVIVMEANDILQENDESLAEEIIALPLSATEMNKLFGWSEKTPDFQYEESEVFNKVRQILSHPNLEEGRPLSISQRKEIVIRQYCAQAGSLMRSFGCEDLKALDLAILQHVLPQVRGSGQKFANRLEKLKQTCSDEGLKESAKYLERMLAYGKTELHSYDFFCW